MIEDIIIISEDKTPIFEQLERQIQRFISSGQLKPGDELPSVRSIAAKIAVNPMTVSKAITRLVDAGWLQHQRGKSTRVASVLPKNINQTTDTHITKEAQKMIMHAKQAGLSQRDLTDLIKTLWH